MWGTYGVTEGLGKISSPGGFSNDFFLNSKVYLERFGSTEDWNGKKEVKYTIFCCECLLQG